MGHNGFISIFESQKSEIQNKFGRSMGYIRGGTYGMKDYLDRLCKDKKDKDLVKKLKKYENSFYSTFLNSLAGYSGA